MLSMKSIRSVALSALLSIGAFSAVMYTSCSKDECKDVVCQNGGTCADGKCTCTTGYEGTNCETKSRDKFIGTYVGTEICSTGNDAYSITLAANSDALKLTMTNIYNNTPPYTATCTMTSTTAFSFTGSSGTVNFTGNGSLSSNTITITYTIADGSASNSCTFTGNK